VTTPTTPKSSNTSRREAILDEAIEVFAREGFRGTDVQVIADRAGVGKGTIYRYFGNKEDLFYAVSMEITRRKEAAMLEAMEGIAKPKEKLRAAARAFAELFQNHPDYVELFVQDRAEFRGRVPERHREYLDQLLNRFSEVVQAGIDAGEIRPIDVRESLLILSSILHGVAIHACYDLHKSSLSEMSETAVDIFMRGIQTEKTA